MVLDRLTSGKKRARDSSADRYVKDEGMRKKHGEDGDDVRDGEEGKDDDDPPGVESGYAIVRVCALAFSFLAFSLIVGGRLMREFNPGRLRDDFRA